MPNSLRKSQEVQASFFTTFSRNLHGDLIKKTEKPSTSIFELWILIPSHDLLWKDIFLLPRSASLGSKIRELQYKVLNRILYTNKSLFKMGIVASPLSTFCQTSEESLAQIYTLCNINCFLTLCTWKTYDGCNWCSILILQPPCCSLFNRDFDIFYQYILAWM